MVIGQIPPSLNQWMHFHWAEKHRIKRIFIEELIYVIKQDRNRWDGRATIPKYCDHVTVKATIFFPQKRRRDSSNYGAVLNKFIGDGLVEAGVVYDDTSGQITFAEPVLGHDEKPMTLITLEIEENQIGTTDENVPPLS